MKVFYKTAVSITLSIVVITTSQAPFAWADGNSSTPAASNSSSKPSLSSQDSADVVPDYIQEEGLPESIESFEKLVIPGDDTKSVQNTADQDIPENLPATVKAYQDVSVPMDVSEEEGLQIIKETQNTTPEKFEAIDVAQELTTISKIILMGHGKKLHEFTSQVINQLKVAGDNPFYTIRFSPSPIPNAERHVGQADMTINAGLLAYVKNVDEYAFIIAHEMTHDNQKFMKGMNDSREVQDILNQISGYNNLKPEQREEIRADLGAVERLIRAGYNPWAGYDFFRRSAQEDSKSWDSKMINYILRIFSKHSFSYMEAHPAREIRMAAIKAFMIYKSHIVDISQNIQQFHKFPMSLNILCYRIGLITTSLTNIWFHRAIYTGVGFILLDQLANAIFATSVTDSSVMSYAHAVISTGANKVNSLFSYLFSFLNYFDSSDFNIDDTVDYTSLVVKKILISSAFLLLGSTLYNLNLSSEYEPSKDLFENLKQFHPNTELFLRKIYELENPSNDQFIVGIKKLSVTTQFIQKIYQDSTLIAHPTRRFFNGLARIKYYYNNQLIIFLRRITEDLKTHRRELSNEEFSRLSNALDSIAGYQFENPIVCDLLNQIYLNHYNKPIDKNSGFSDDISVWVNNLKLKLSFNKRKNLDNYQLIDLAYHLYNANLKDTSFKIIGSFPEKFFDYVLSKDNPNPISRGRLLILYRAFKEGQRSLRPNTWLSTLKEAWINNKRLWEGSGTLAENLRSISITKTIPYAWMGSFSFRKFLDGIEWGRSSMRKQIDSQFSNIRDFDLFVEENLVQYNVDMSVLSDEMYKAVLRNPQWIQSEKDLEILFQKDYFWPTVSGNEINWSPVEKLFAENINYNMRVFPGIWKYEPSVCEKLHITIVNALKKIGKYPNDLNGKISLWKKLTTRGVTTTTDAIFDEIYPQLNSTQMNELESLATKDGRVWESEIKMKIVQKNLSELRSYKNLMHTSASTKRLDYLEDVISYLKAVVPERGVGFMNILEKISIDINSTREESAMIARAKTTANTRGVRQEDLGLRVLSDVLNSILSWKKQDQWDFILYIRGDIEVTENISRAFSHVGPERIRRIFQLLPTMAKTIAIDAFMDAPAGLLGDMQVGSGWSQKIVDHIMQGKSDSESGVARELLNGFLFALKQTNNKPLRSYVLSYLISLPKSSTQNNGQTLKNVLELFGTTGVKIGQFLVASNLLPDDINKVLRELQEQAKIPEREDIYKDLEAIFGTTNLPFDLKNLLGAASLKYVMLAEEHSTEENIVLKILRLESIAHTRMEFNILEKMCDYLMQRYGKKYGVFTTIIKASQKAVERELLAQEEVNNGRIADKYVYVKASDAKFNIKVPKERMVKDRLIVSEVAEGVSFFNIKTEFQPAIAEKILQMEHDILFSNKAEIIFDPDRHAGNYRIHLQNYSGEDYIVLESTQISPIDFGQLIRKFTPADRDTVEFLFALSQIGSKTGAIDWMVEKINSKLAMTAQQKINLAKTLRMYFPTNDIKPVTAYFSILSAIELAGYEVDIKYFDFVRAIIQLKQYEPFVQSKRNWQTPSEAFETRITSQVEKLKPEIELNWREKMMYSWHNPTEVWDYLKSYFSSQKQESSPIAKIDTVAISHGAIKKSLPTISAGPVKCSLILQPALH